LTQFVGAALTGGNPAIVAATESRRDALLPRLQVYGLDIGAAIEQGRYVTLDAVDALCFIYAQSHARSGTFLKVFDQLIRTAAKAAKGNHPRLAIFGECVHLLWMQGNAAAAIHIERLCNQLIKAYDVNILCGYLPSSAPGEMDGDKFQRICAEHSAVPCI
jgi:hypothetical protein